MQNPSSIQDLEGYVEETWIDHTLILNGCIAPKLARMMIYYASVDKCIVWVPFCGSGTVLMECAVLGYDFLGSDIDDDALEYSQENILWLNEKRYMGNIVYDIFKFDVKNPDKEIVKKLKHKRELFSRVCNNNP